MLSRIPELGAHDHLQAAEVTQDALELLSSDVLVLDRLDQIEDPILDLLADLFSLGDGGFLSWKAPQSGPPASVGSNPGMPDPR